MIYVDDLGAPELAQPDVEHLFKSRRLTVGDQVNIGDGRGRWAPARLSSGRGRVDVLAEPVSVPPPHRRRGVAFAPTKGVKPESVVRQLTELGIDEITIVRSQRSVVTYNPARAERLLRRLAVTVREAGQQSRQAWLPRVVGVIPLADLLGTAGQVLLADPAGQRLDSSVSPARSALTVAVGPEGGWTDDERRLADTVSLPGGILRTETAAIAVGVLLVAFGE